MGGLLPRWCPLNCLVLISYIHFVARSAFTAFYSDIRWTVPWLITLRSSSPYESYRTVLIRHVPLTCIIYTCWLGTLSTALSFDIPWIFPLLITMRSSSTYESYRTVLTRHVPLTCIIYASWPGTLSQLYLSTFAQLFVPRLLTVRSSSIHESYRTVLIRPVQLTWTTR